jgi:hypothetical protein
MGSRTIALVANTALKRIAKLNLLRQGGNPVDIRRKPHVIDVALDQNTQHSC